MPSRLLRLILIVSLFKLICAAFWPVNGEEALLWANARSGAPLPQADAFTDLVAQLATGTGACRLLLLRLPGLVATTLCLWPMLSLARMLGRDGRAACTGWLALHCLPGVFMASAGWNREGLMLLVALSATASGLAGARGSKFGATVLGWIAGLSLLIHPFAPLTAICALAWPMERGKSTPAVPCWRVLQGLLPAVLLVGLINGEDCWNRVLYLGSSLHMNLSFSAILAFALDATLWTGLAFLLLILRSWSELQRKEFQGALTLRVAAVGPLILLFYLGCQGPLDGRLALTPLVIAFLPGLLSPDLPGTLRRKLARFSGTCTFVVMSLLLAAALIPTLGLTLANIAPSWIERTPAARPTTRAMLPALESRVPKGTRIGGLDPIQAALFSFIGESLGDPIHIRWTRPLPSTALLITGKPNHSPTIAGPYSTLKSLPVIRIAVQGREDEVLWIALARDPQKDQTATD